MVDETQCRDQLPTCSCRMMESSDFVRLNNCRGTLRWTDTAISWKMGKSLSISELSGKSRQVKPRLYREYPCRIHQSRSQARVSSKNWCPFSESVVDLVASIVHFLCLSRRRLIRSRILGGFKTVLILAHSCSIPTYYFFHWTIFAAPIQSLVSRIKMGLSFMAETEDDIQSRTWSSSKSFGCWKSNNGCRTIQITLRNYTSSETFVCTH